jgi:hypothetical protein
MKTYTYDRTDQPGQYQLTLTHVGYGKGDIGVNGKAQVQYWLRNVDSLVHSLYEGDHLFVSPGQDPEGPQSASDVLVFFLAAEAEKGIEDYYDLETWQEDLEHPDTGER